MSGNPRMAIKAAFCWALAAIAASNVKTRLRLIPPTHARPMNNTILLTGAPNNTVNKNKLTELMTSISKTL